VAAVEILPSKPEGEDHGRLVDALQKLAAALPQISQDQEVAATGARIRALAGQIGEMPTGTLQEGRVVRSSLQEAVRGLDGVSGHAAYTQRQDASAALEQFDPRTPVSAQGAVIRRVLASVANGLLIARGQDPVIAAAANEPKGREPGALPQRSPVEKASSLIAKMSQESWRDGRHTGADALASLAQALEEVPAARPAVERIRADADRLRGADDLDLHVTGYIRSALLAAVDALAPVQPDEGGGLRPWLERARAAAVAIEDGSSFAFQRAAIQEAFRTVVDAFMASTDLGARAQHGA
jgi:hypothetical protein